MIITSKVAAISRLMQLAIVLVGVANLVLLTAAVRQRIVSVTDLPEISTPLIMSDHLGRKIERLSRKKFKRDISAILKNYELSAKQLIKSNNRNLQRLLLARMGESTQLGLVKDWGNASLQTLRNKLNDATADMKEAVRKLWEEREGPIRMRRNPFDGSSKKQPTVDVDRRDASHARFAAGFRGD